jgi:hypothetical protein
MLAIRIDQRMDEQRQANHVPIAPRCNDAEFVRRIHLDLVGHIPSAGRVREFLADQDPNKREKLIDELSESPASFAYFARVWRRFLNPEGETDDGVRYVAQEFEAWLRKQFADNVHYDELVRRILTVELVDEMSTYRYRSFEGEPTPTGFFATANPQPERYATATARAFLGVRVDCAQCHDHPTSAWKREQFWSFAAFFQPPQVRRGLFGIFGRRETVAFSLKIPNTNTMVTTAFLDGRQPSDTKRPPRESLAEWIISRDNPYFARAAVNRVWSHFFGRGLIDPVDDMEQSAGTHPELLQELAEAFRDSNFDLRYLTRAIMISQAYQLSSEAVDPRQLEPQWYARTMPKKMSGDQFKESLLIAAGLPVVTMEVDPYSDSGIVDETDKRFRSLIEGGNDRPIDKPTSLLESLMLMNGEMLQAASNERASIIAAVSDIPGLSDEQRIASLFLSTLSREPTAGEQERLLVQLRSATSDPDRKAFFSDLMWALLNCSEFALNH